MVYYTFAGLLYLLAGEATSYLLTNGVFQEIHWFKQAYGSWFLGDYVCEGKQHWLAELRLQCTSHIWDIRYWFICQQMADYMLPHQLILFSFCCPFLMKQEWRYFRDSHCLIISISIASSHFSLNPNTCSKTNWTS